MAGVAPPIVIPGEKFSKRTGQKFTQVSTVKLTVMGKKAELSAPVLQDGAEISPSFGVNLNVFPEFSFDKISMPEYGASKELNGTDQLPIARFTGLPYYADFLKDYYFISIFRLADKLTTPHFSGKIKEQFSTPGGGS